MKEPENNKKLCHVLKQNGCEHYKRKVRLVAPCCGKVYTCRRCHDESEDHKMKRHMVEEVECLNCQLRQPVGRNCAQCGTLFGRYFCSECRLYDDEPKQQYHCTGCGICRTGGRQNFFHCDRCDICLPMNLKDNHKCIDSVGRADCSVCLEDLHSALDGARVLPCGHLLHRACFRSLLEHAITTCPECNASVCDMQRTWARLDGEIKRSRVPSQYRDCFVDVLCRDCHRCCRTRFHVLGLKCAGCGSYNTVREAGPLIRRGSASRSVAFAERLNTAIQRIAQAFG